MEVSMTEFELHPQLAADTVPIRDLVLSRLLLMNDRRFPWFILVPMRPGASEIVDLDDDDRAMLWREIDAVAHAAKAVFSPDKLNIAALGNAVPQLHVHIIARFRNDAIWPKVVWGFGTGEPYAPGESETVMSACSSFLMDHGW
jgi:diadenosine tetraphosphate (Ap4A) HIT family hydrolase